MKQIRLEATDPIHEINIDLSGVYGYEKDPNGVDLLCGHCDAVMFEAHPIGSSGRMVMQGVKCQSCGGQNTFDTNTFKGE